MATAHRYAATRVVFLQILVLALLAPTAKSLFGVTALSSVSDILGNRNFRQQNNSPHSPLSIDENSSRTTDNVQHAAADDDEGLVFEGEFHYQSDIVPIPKGAMMSPATDLFDFFSDPKNRDLAIKGGGNPCESIPLTPELHQEWTSQSKIVQSTPPSKRNQKNAKDEEILAVYSEVPIVPGLSLRACSYTGCKTMKEPNSALPYYEFTLLKESYQPVGKKAMTWIFDKVTGNKKTNGENKMDTMPRSTIVASARSNGSTIEAATEYGDSSSRKTYALSRVMLKPFPQDGGCKICYYGHVRLTLSKKFLHMLPLPAKVVQRTVNKSIRKQLESECSRSIEKFAGALNRWNEQESTSGTTRVKGIRAAFRKQ